MLINKYFMIELIFLLFLLQKINPVFFFVFLFIKITIVGNDDYQFNI